MNTSSRVIHIGFWTFLLAIVSAGVARAAEAAATKLNVLFIAFDDLRPALGCYGDPNAITPNLDKLAARGTVFERAYCQQALCSPTRTSLLTGLRPDTTRIYDLTTHFRTTIPEVVTLPQIFKNNGYHAQGFGKIYHGGLNDEASWSAPWTGRSGPEYLKPESLAAVKAQKEKGKETSEDLRGPAWEDPDCRDEDLADGRIATQAIECLRQVKDKPFFLAVGMARPHLPFVAPKRYFDQHPMDKFKLPPNYAAPKDVPEIAMHNFGELRRYHNIPKTGAVADQQALELIRAYYAATSYADAQVGRVLDELEKSGLRDKTIVIAWGDHGWHLGDQGLWCKHTNFEAATHAMMILSAPGQKQPGAKSRALVEFVDIYPTLCELAALPPPNLEGKSFSPLLDEPNRPWKAAAFSQYPRKGNVMGYSMRTERYRYTEWRRPDKTLAGVELYDHEKDPGETVNLAGRSEQATIIENLSKAMADGWRAAAGS